MTGIYLGMKLLSFLNFETYDLMGMYDKDKKLLPLKKWRVFECHRHFSAVCLVIFFGKLNFINRFLVLNGLWIPKTHYLNFFKLFMYRIFNINFIIKIN